MKITAEVIGQKKLNRKLRQLYKKLEKPAGDHLHNEAKGVMAASQQLVPKDTGALASTGHVNRPVRRLYDTFVVMGYGGRAGRGGSPGPFISITGKMMKAGDNVDYALKVHEDYSVHHYNGTAGFLGKPFKQAAKGVAKRMASVLKRNIK